MRLQDRYKEKLNISYRSIAIYVSNKKKDLRLDTNEYLKLKHLPGAAQIDFRKLTFTQGGKIVKGSYFVLSWIYADI